MKRVFTILLILLVVMIFAGCAKTQEKVAEFAEPTPLPQETQAPIQELYALGEPPYYETFDEVVLKSDAILIGTAGEASCKRTREDWVKTHTEFQVREILKGSVPEDNCVTIVQNGGEADGLRLVVEEAGVSVPYLQEGVEYLLFLSTSASVSEPEFYVPMNSFVIYEIKGETVYPVSLYSDFIVKPTPIEAVREQIENSLS